ncbi:MULTISPECIES: efflux RND transporter periplasmic adaptor subunit [Brenneria]|uniref:Efflux RND transporter periplasmic adaptor subunit n=1 Tax=Brenneria nigrifluens DSM 30175 = ATCC 13028 TaxID=1121120 RepID=A0A2U1URQ6_9GAMM|nr:MULTISPECIES: efflux RND transporter periplasmic adaptor subunit [Brenneria]EHD23061.1 secretion protein HlyD family protein [Brenneria sp. EniD312]PWC24353.1 efflux RND transporter periplasmic adaptor subunit [Brenneria nigrifluens DSM 30175 = ATCC 13028]QCR05952.1 efflux RND transporter periplasmic adaptor subunit [Brenneria nigrifluens DSM 30175 = ATCC 13028]
MKAQRFLLAGALLTPLWAQAAGDGDIRVQLSALRYTTLSSEIAGKVTDIAVKEGEHFKQGDTLLTFDCTVLKEKLNYSAAAENAARKKLAIANRLDKLNSISLSEVDQARSAVSMAQAESGVNRAMLQRCAIKAPFSGRVTESKVKRWESVPEGKELLSIYDDSAFELEMIVPSRWLAWLKQGDAFQVTLDETGLSYPAEISRISSAVEPVSQSVKVFGRITQSTAGLLPGMSGVAQIAPPAAGVGAP